MIETTGTLAGTSLEPLVIKLEKNKEVKEKIMRKLIVFLSLALVLSSVWADTRRQAVQENEKGVIAKLQPGLDIAFR